VNVRHTRLTVGRLFNFAPPRRSGFQKDMNGKSGSLMESRFMFGALPGSLLGRRGRENLALAAGLRLRFRFGSFLRFLAAFVLASHAYKHDIKAPTRKVLFRNNAALQRKNRLQQSRPSSAGFVVLFVCRTSLFTAPLHPKDAPEPVVARQSWPKECSPSHSGSRPLAYPQSAPQS
jgi:hypothetical protein